MRSPGPGGGRGRLGAVLVGFLPLWAATLGLEVSVGKAPVIYVQNGTDVLLPCTFTSCIGIKDTNFTWIYNHTEIFKGIIVNKDSRPQPYEPYKSGFKYVLPKDIALSKDNREFNVSLLLLFADFSDSGKYTCQVKNPKEKNAATQSNTITLQVVLELEKKDNTLTLIIVSVVGGVLGLLILILVIKKVVVLILKKTKQEKTECLVSSSVNDNTGNGQPGPKAKEKPAPKA